MAHGLSEPITLVLDEKHLIAIGKVATLWGSFELALSGIIWFLMDADSDRAACVTTQIQGWAGKLNAIYSLSALLGVDDKTLKNIEKYAQKTNGFAQQRNRIVHDPWMLGTDTGMHYRLEISWTPSNKFTFEHKPMGFDDIKDFAVSFDKHSKNLWVIYEQIKSDPALQEAWRERRSKPSTCQSPQPPEPKSGT